MNTTISLDSLWLMIQSLPLRNKKWLTERLIENVRSEEGLTEEYEPNACTVKAMQDVRAGKVTYVSSVDELFDQILG